MSKYRITYPLAGQTIVVTRATGAASEFRQLLEAKGAVVLELPALVIKPPSSWLSLDQAITEMNGFDWLILTSANGVKYFWQRWQKMGKNKQDLQHLQIAVVGKKTAQVLNHYGLSANFIPPDFVADAMVANFPATLSGCQMLFPRVETGGRDVLVQQFTARGARVVEVPAYQSGCPDTMDDTVLSALETGIVDIITFASSKTVQNFYTLLAKSKGEKVLHSLLKSVVIASIGPQTSLTCIELFKRVDIEAPEYTLSGLGRALEVFVTQ